MTASDAAHPATIPAAAPEVADADAGNGKLGLREVYRMANHLDLDQAADQYNAASQQLGADSVPDYPMTAAKLRRYEIWPGHGGERPPILTLALLSNIYQTELSNLLSPDEYARLPASDQVIVRSQPEKQNQPKSSIVDSLVGQATAAIAVVAAIVYAAGGLTLGLKLWFFGLPWTSVLGQLPHDFLLVTAAGQVILPALTIGAAVGFAIHKLRGAGARRGAWYLFAPLAIAVSAATGSILALLPLLVIHFTASSARPLQPVSGLLQPSGRIYLFCSAASFVTVLVAVCLIRGIYRSASFSGPVRLALAMAMTSFALIPSVASVSAAYLLPPVVLCAPNFLHPVAGKPEAGAMTGNLIGSNSQWIYIAQFTVDTSGQVIRRTITAVPASAARLEGIGLGSGCGDLSSTTR